MLGAAGVSDISHKLRYELRPLGYRDLGAGDAGDTLRRRAGAVRLRAQRLQNLEPQRRGLHDTKTLTGSRYTAEAPDE